MFPEPWSRAPTPDVTRWDQMNTTKASRRYRLWERSHPASEVGSGLRICASGRRRSDPVVGRRVRSGIAGAVLLGVLAISTGCAAAVSAALAAGDIRKGIAGLQQLVGGTRSLQGLQLEVPDDLASPLAGTYRGFQALGADTVHFYVRTAERAAAPIVDEAGNITGYALAGLVATTLDTLEARVGAPLAVARRNARRGGRSVFFVEGTQVPTPGARALFPAAFLGRVSPGESAAADRQDAELRRLDLDMGAPNYDDLAGRGIPHELFGSVADGVFTLRPDGGAVYHQEYEMENGQILTLHFERISRTTLPGIR